MARNTRNTRNTRNLGARLVALDKAMSGGLSDLLLAYEAAATLKRKLETTEDAIKTLDDQMAVVEARPASARNEARYIELSDKASEMEHKRDEIAEDLEDACGVVQTELERLGDAVDIHTANIVFGN